MDIEIPIEEELAEGFEAPEVTSTLELDPVQDPEWGWFLEICVKNRFYPFYPLLKEKLLSQRDYL